MDFLIQTIIPYVLLYKYWALFLITFLSALAIPIPAGSLLVASAAFASQGYFKITTLFLVVILANIAGDNLSFYLSRKFGRTILEKYKLTRNIIGTENFKIIFHKIAKTPGLIIFLSRFEVLATLTVNLICGVSKVKYKKYLPYEIAGTIASVGFYATLGYIFGDSWEAINKLIGNFTIVIFVAILICVMLFWKKIMHNLAKE